MVSSPDNRSFLPFTFHRNASAVRRKLLAWFQREGRDFPWRSVNRAASRREGEPIHDPYEILVSEVMLQQTQTARVVEKLPEFLQRFPTIEALAGASRGELLRAWRGMGYNSRAIRLQETARAIVEEQGGRFPEHVDDLRKLPGVGRYTASAVACFAFGADVAVVDVNVIRVLSRLFYKCHTPEQLLPERTVIRLAEAILPPGDAYHWHQALMDLGATICTARRPSCRTCPLRSDCLSAFPSAIMLFHPSDIALPEPMLRGEPRRLWRGRIIELLRDWKDGLPLADLLDRLLPSALFEETASDRRELLRLAQVLYREGLIERRGVVHEGDLNEHDRISLPQ